MTSPARLRTSRSHTGPVPPPAEARAGFVLYVSLPDTGTDGAAFPTAAELTSALPEACRDAPPSSDGRLSTTRPHALAPTEPAASSHPVPSEPEGTSE